MDNIKKLEEKILEDNYYKNDEIFSIRILHVRNKVEYDVNTLVSKFKIEYSDKFNKPKVIFSWVRYGSDGNNDIYYVSNDVRSCVLILPIGYDKYNLNQYDK